MLLKPVSSSFLITLAFATAISTPRSAWADDRQEPPPPPPLYPAPLSQRTQTTYVPQSVALSGPEEIDDYDESRPLPPGYTALARPRKGLIIGGAVTLGVTYTLAALVAAAGEDASNGGKNDVAALWVPVAGPFIQMGRTDSAAARVFLFQFGAAQAAGAIMLVFGLSSPHYVLVRNDLVGVTITPVLGGGSSGMMVSGRF